MNVGTTSADAIRRASSRLALDLVEGVRLYCSGVVGYAADDPVEDDAPVDESVDDPVDSDVALLEGNPLVEDPDSDSVDVLVDDVSDPSASEVSVADDEVDDGVSDADVVDCAEVSPAGFGSAVPAIVVAQPPTSTAATASAAAVHLLRLIDESFSAELGVPAPVEFPR